MDSPHGVMSGSNGGSGGAPNDSVQVPHAESLLSCSSGKVGLQNLGNSCYMNSALQCLLHVPELNYYFVSDSYKLELNVDNPLGSGGRIAGVFAQLVHNLFDLKRVHPPTFAPRDFKHTVGRFNSMFSSYHQQDSQEFLSYLLDGLHEDLNRIVKKPYTEKPELTNIDQLDPLLIQQLAAKSWETHLLRNDSVINDLFVGLYKSTLVCPECHKISVTFDPYNALTLPLPADQSWSHKVLILPEQGLPKSFEVELNKTSTFHDLKRYVSDKVNIPITDLICMEVFNCQFFKNYESNDADIGYMPIEGLIQKDDLIVFYELKHCAGDLVVPVFNTFTNDTSSEVKPFGIPFFIALSEEERNSFGAIREKLEKRYDQLSTYNYFTQVRSRQQSVHTLKDFPLLQDKYEHHFLEKQKVVTEEEDIDQRGYDSDISLANPDIPGDYAFSVKVFDASKESKPRFYSSNHTEDVEDDELWVPKTSNNFRNLPSLLDRLPEIKKLFYTYNEDMFEDSSESAKMESTQEDPLEVELEHVEVSEPQESQEAANDNDEDEEMDLGPAFHSLLDSDSENVTPSSNSPTPQLFINPQDDLISEKMALVCEWKFDLFDTFFTGMEEEGEGGKETWTNPEEIPNEELMAKKLERELLKLQHKNITLYDCLKLFEQPEVLGDQDLWYCPSCKKHTNATKSLEVWSTPDILTVHLKRFASQRSLSDKIGDVVEFPIEGLDVAPYVMSNDGKETIYDLFAVDNHYGGLGGGHYTAYVKNFVDDSWYYFDDSRVSPRDPEDSVSGSAYLLFYRRRKPTTILGNDDLSEIIIKEQERQQLEIKLDQERILKLIEEKQRKLAEEQLSSVESETNDDEEMETPSSTSSSKTGSTSESTDAPPVIVEPATTTASSLITNPPLRKRRKGNNISSPILSPLLPLEDPTMLTNNGESDVESLKGSYSPGLVPSTTGKIFQSSGLADSPISMIDNEDELESKDV